MPTIAEALTDSARARAMTPSQLARELAQPVAHVRATMRALASRVTGRPIPHVSDVDTMDRLLAIGGRASAAGSMRGASVPLRLGRHRLNLPHCRCHAGEAAGPTGPNYAPPGTPGYYRVSPLDQCWYTIEAGDNPALIAYWITGAGTLARVRELLDANPDLPKTGTPGTWSYNFASFNPGNKIKLPKAWNLYLALQPKGGGYTYGSKGGVYPEAPAAPPPAPPVASTDDWLLTAPAGTVAAAKAKLGAWGTAEKIAGWAYPGLYDMNDTVDEAFRKAVASFQAWANARGAGLRSDGRFDKPTAERLAAYVPGAVPTPPGTLPPIVPPALPPLPPIVPVKFEPGETENESSGAVGAVLLLALAGFFLLKGR